MIIIIVIIIYTKHCRLELNSQHRSRGRQNAAATPEIDPYRATKTISKININKLKLHFRLSLSLSLSPPSPAAAPPLLIRVPSLLRQSMITIEGAVLGLVLFPFYLN